MTTSIQPPDFEQLAARMAQGTVVNTSGGSEVLPRAIQKFAEQLRQVWNARGAADMEALEPILGANMDAEKSALRSLDK